MQTSPNLRETDSKPNKIFNVDINRVNTDSQRSHISTHMQDEKTPDTSHSLFWSY